MSGNNTRGAVPLKGKVTPMPKKKVGKELPEESLISRFRAILRIRDDRYAIPNIMRFYLCSHPDWKDEKKPAPKGIMFEVGSRIYWFQFENPQKSVEKIENLISDFYEGKKAKA